MALTDEEKNEETPVVETNNKNGSSDQKNGPNDAPCSSLTGTQIDVCGKAEEALELSDSGDLSGGEPSVLEDYTDAQEKVHSVQWVDGGQVEERPSQLFRSTALIYPYKPRVISDVAQKLNAISEVFNENHHTPPDPDFYERFMDSLIPPPTWQPYVVMLLDYMCPGKQHGFRIGRYVPR